MSGSVFLGSSPGVRGATGPQGPTKEAPSDNFAYGRAPGSWQRVLPLTGTGGVMSGGISFGSDVASSWADVSRHLALNFNTGVGINVTAGTQNYVSASQFAVFQFNVNGARAVSLSSTGGQLQVFIGSVSASNAPMRFNSQSGQFIWVNSLTTIANGAQTSNLNCQGELTVFDVGIRYLNGANGISWRWDGTWILTRVDQNVEYPVANACDERLKQDIALSSFDCLAAMKRIRLWQYRWRDRSDPMKFKRTRRAPLAPLGLVAQRLNEDFPEGVVRPRSQVGTAVQMWNADSNTMLAALTGAVQQLADRVDAVRARGM